jgi:hypothetical protein
LLKIEKNIFALSLCLVAATASLPACDAKATAAKPVKALVLQQEHVYLGQVKIMMTPTAVRMDGLGKFHFSLVSKAPTWKVTAFRTDDKLFFTQGFDEFCDQGLFSNFVMTKKERNSPPGIKPTMRKISGFPVQQRAYGAVTAVSMDIKEYGSANVEEFLYAAYKLPTDRQIPIAFKVILTGKDWLTRLSEEGQRRVFLSTSKISYVPISMSEFEIPAGLKPAKSITRIIVGDSRGMKKTGVDVLFEYDKR